MSAVLRIVLTGGIGSGKSTVASKFKNLGVPIIDTDVISRELVEPNKPCLKAITHEFGEKLLTETGTLDRNKLREIIFKDEVAKKKLEQILHPEIYREIEKKVSEVEYPYCLIVVPLLIETEMTDNFDRILVVDIPEETQIKRASQRDKSSTGKIEKIVNSQVTREQRLKYADDIITNNVALEELDDSIYSLHKKYIELSNNSRKE